MPKSTPEQLRFPPVAGLSVRGDFNGGTLSSDFGPMLLRGIDQRIALSERLSAAFQDRRHPSYIEHPLRDLIAQRVYQVACGYEDANDANRLRTNALFKLGLEHNRKVHALRCENARRAGGAGPHSTRSYHEVDDRAGSWPKAFRTILKAEVMGLGDNPRFVVTSLDLPSPECVYRDLYCARGQDENFIKLIKNDLASDRTSDHNFLANQMRLFFSCAAYVLHQTLRSDLLADTELAKAQPSTVIIKLFKIAVRVVQYQDRVRLHLPSSCPMKALLKHVTEQLLVPAPRPILSG